MNVRDIFMAKEELVAKEQKLKKAEIEAFSEMKRVIEELAGKDDNFKGRIRNLTDTKIVFIGNSGDYWTVYAWEQTSFFGGKSLSLNYCYVINGDQRICSRKEWERRFVQYVAMYLKDRI